MKSLAGKAKDLASAPDMDSAESIADIAKALGHPARVHIVRLLLEKQSCIGCDIVDEVGLAQSTVSEHLRILKAANLISGEIERPRVCYRLNPESLLPLTALLHRLQEPAGPQPVSRPAARKKLPAAQRRPRQRAAVARSRRTEP